MWITEELSESCLNFENLSQSQSKLVIVIGWQFISLWNQIADVQQLTWVLLGVFAACSWDSYMQACGFCSYHYCKTE